VGPRILVVDDDPQLLRAIRPTLSARGYEPHTAESGEAALDQFGRLRPDVVLLDLGLPGIDGLAVIRRIREHHETPIVVLSARGEERDKVAALDLGADDYLTKPFGLDELLARVRVALRHAAPPGAPPSPDGVVRVADLEVDPVRRRVRARGREVHLSPTEWSLLELFVAHPDRVLTHRFLLQRVWGPEYGDEGNYLHVYVAGLRKKLEADPRRPRHLLTEPGVGYRFRVDPA
jgi:two-component system, OmpR family, KDP operon response regulator KdpE